MQIYLRLHPMGLAPRPMAAIESVFGPEVVIVNLAETANDLATAIELVARIRPCGLEFGAGADLHTIQAFCLRLPHIPVFRFDGEKLEQFVWSNALVSDEVAKFETVEEWRAHRQAEFENEELRRQYRHESGDTDWQ